MYGINYLKKLENWKIERESLVSLRKAGKTYGEIASILGSGWNYNRVANRFRVMKNRGEYDHTKDVGIFADTTADVLN